MKKLIFILMVSSLSNCTKSQSWEKGICECIETNYNLQNWNYFEEISAFEKEMMERGKFESSLESKIELLNSLGNVEYVDFYKHQFSERLLTFGEESLFYCVRRELFNKNCQEKHWSEKLIMKLKVHKATLQKDGNLKIYNKNVAESIVKTIKNNEGEIKLKKLIILQELYRRIPDEAWYNLDQTKLKILSEQKNEINKSNKHNVIEILVNEENEIYLRGNPIQIEKLKDTINIMISNISSNPNFPEDPKRVIIALRNQKGTSYQKYQEVYKEIKEANTELRKEESRNLFNKALEELNKNELRKIRSEIPFIISEAKPE